MEVLFEYCSKLTGILNTILFRTTFVQMVENIILLTIFLRSSPDDSITRTG